MQAATEFDNNPPAPGSDATQVLVPVCITKIKSNVWHMKSWNTTQIDVMKLPAYTSAGEFVSCEFEMRTATDGNPLEDEESMFESITARSS